MYTLLRSIGSRQFIVEQTPILVASLVIAEFFYKFHSFTLECLAFIGTWYLLDRALSFFRKRSRTEPNG